MSRVPRIRFKGFEEDWEQRKLGEVTTSYSGGTPNVSNCEYYGDEIPFIRSGEINNCHTDLFITEKGLLNSSAAMVKEGDILYALYGATSGEVSRSKLKGAINQAILAILPKTKYDSEYIAQWLKIKKRYIVDTYLQGGQGNLSGNIVKNFIVDFSSYNEQLNIGNLASSLDHLITLHQRKLEKLKTIKKSMLENLFPQNGEKTPKIRFSGFTEDWEQRKLGEVFIYLRNNTLSREELNDEDGFAQSIHYGDVLIKYGECLNVSKVLLPYVDNKNIVNKFKKFYIQNGDIIIADTAEDETVGKCIEISGLVDHNIISGLHTIPLRPVNKFAYGYLGFYLNSNSYHNQLKPLMQGIKVTSISKNLLKTTTLNYPSNIQEQKIIGRYFDALDHLITLHQSKLEKLQKIKKSMLESMFV